MSISEDDKRLYNLERKVKDNTSDAKVALKEIKDIVRDIRKVKSSIQKLERLAGIIQGLAGLTSTAGSSKALEKVNNIDISSIAKYMKDSGKDKADILQQMMGELMQAEGAKSADLWELREFAKMQIDKDLDVKINQKLANVSNKVGRFANFSPAQILWITGLILQIVTIAINEYEVWAKAQRVRELEMEKQRQRREYSNNVRNKFYSGVAV